MPNVTAAQPNIGHALCESSVIPFLVPRRKVANPAAGVPCSNAASIGERKTWTQSEFCTWRNSVRGKSPRKCVYIYIYCTSPGDGHLAIFCVLYFQRAARAQHVSDLHSKICTKATPCVEVWQMSNLRPLRLDEEKKEERRNHMMKIYMACPIT